MDGVEDRGVAPAHAMDVSPTTRPDPHPSASAAALALQRRMVFPMELGCADIASISKVDFFSLDVEGAEQLVLRTMNWRVPVGVWLIELSCTSGAARNDAIRLELARHGYGPYNLDKVPLPPERFLDNEVFLHRDLLHQLPQRVATCRRCEQI